MPLRRNNLPRFSRRRTADAGPPPTMTWTKAMPVLVVCLVFDAVRAFFEQFWILGPSLAAAICTALGHHFVGALGGLTAVACTATGGAVVYFFGGPLQVFGNIMAIAVGLAGWLTVGALLMATNSRIFKENGFQFAISLLISEIPIIGTLPALVIIVWRMYRTQIKKETATLKKYQAEQEAAQAEERQQQIAQFMAAQAENEEYAAEQQALAEAENEEEEIPEERLKAA